MTGPPPTLAAIAPRGIGEIAEGDDLATIVLDALAGEGMRLEAGDVVVLAQKIVSKSEGRRVALAGVAPSEEARALAARTEKDPRLMELVLRESQEVMRARPGLVVVRHRLGHVLANAGIDASNVAAGHALLLPENPDRSCAALRAELRRRTGVTAGVVVNDSLGRAWRLGTVGAALGAAGLPALLDLRGTADRFGRELQTSELGLADEIAAAASIVMGQAAEGRPMALVRGLPYPLGAGRAADLIRPAARDLFG